MKRLYPNVVVPGMLALALGLSACSSTQGEGSSASGGNGGIAGTSAGDSARADALSAPTPASAPAPASVPQSGMLADSGSEAPASGAPGASGASGAGGSGTASEQKQAIQHGGTPPIASNTPNGTVVSIEPLAMGASAGGAGGTGSSGSGSGTASGSGTGTGTGTNGGGGNSRSAREQAYRITLRMDDGSTQVLNQSSTPTYRSGDRVNLSNGVISR